MQHADQPKPAEDSISGPDDYSAAREPVGPRGHDREEGDRSMDPDEMTLADVIDAEAARPDLPDETSDGLDDMDEEIRHQAEDLPLDTLRRE